MKAKVGVVGAGTYGSVLINAYYGAHKRGEIEFAAVADINPDTLKSMNEKYGIKGYTDYREMFDKEGLDAVAVVTPDYLHEEVVLEAAKRKIHILAQKPLSTDIEQGKRMIQAAKDNNVMLYVDFHKRFDPAHIQLRNAIKEGRLGEIEYGYVCMEDKILVPSVWFKNWAQNSSPAWFIGIHFFDLIYWLWAKNQCGYMPPESRKNLHPWALIHMIPFSPSLNLQAGPALRWMHPGYFQTAFHPL